VPRLTGILETSLYVTSLERSVNSIETSSGARWLRRVDASAPSVWRIARSSCCVKREPVPTFPLGSTMATGSSTSPWRFARTSSMRGSLD
jgi:hypothetical protein